ncbi:hypothetical protein [Mucilaginibacter sp. NFX135]|uniref:hypothetical protein n=1 Tax=Mucilaginibacter sp. NFX135 TaxID=3402687 RepID=UPI003AFB3579
MKNPIISVFSMCLILLFNFNGHARPAEKRVHKHRLSIKRSAPYHFAKDSMSTSEENARRMVRAFRSKKGLFNSKTSVWFPYRYLELLEKKLIEDKKTKKADGVRIYLARRKGLNTFLLVPTKDDGQNPDFESDPTKRVHLDYYDKPITLSWKPVGCGHDDQEIGDEGATLDNPKCPKSSAIVFEKHDITCEEASAYVNNNKPQDNKDIINTTSEWFELDFITYLKKQILAARAKTVDADGIRIYLARHLPTDPGDLANRHAFIIVTTKKGKGGKNVHQDFYENYSSEKFFATYDNGEQCLNNCHGVTLMD